MKSNITISIDTELINNLKREDNYSDVINRVIKAYYDEKDASNAAVLKKKLEEIKQNIKEKHKEAHKLKLEINKIVEKEKEIIAKVKQKIVEKPERDPILDPDMWIEKGFDKKYPQQWKKHLEFIERRQK